MTSRRPLLLMLAVLATVPALIFTVALRADSTCNGFLWGGHGRCWQKRDGAAFTSWLTRHGSNPARFRNNYPEQAAIFTQPWPAAPPYWRTCETGYRCAVAVLPHYFADWRYALAIVDCETGGTYSAYTRGSAGERGIFQIHPVHFGWVDENRLWDVRYNAAIAVRLSHHGTDWSPWTCAHYV